MVWQRGGQVHMGCHQPDDQRCHRRGARRRVLLLGHGRQTVPRFQLAGHVHQPRLHGAARSERRRRAPAGTPALRLPRYARPRHGPRHALAPTSHCVHSVNAPLVVCVCACVRACKHRHEAPLQGALPRWRCLDARGMLRAQPREWPRACWADRTFGCHACAAARQVSRPCRSVPSSANSSRRSAPATSTVLCSPHRARRRTRPPSAWPVS